MDVAICITAYRRPEMLRTLLRSLERVLFHKVQPPTIAVAVVDNDARCSALPVVAEFSHFRYRLQYRVEPRQGISFARNAALHLTQTADFVAFLDDDEEPSAHWLDELLTVQAAFNASIVAGPVLPNFDSPPAEWLRQGEFHGHKRYLTGARILSAGAGNCLLSREVLRVTGPAWFHAEFAHTGGEDTHFFRRCVGLGFPIIWANDAIVFEHIPDGRLSTSYLISHARNGGNHWTRSQLALDPRPAKLAMRAAAGMFRIAQGCASALAAPLLSRSQRFRGQLRMAEGRGNLDAFLGRSYQTYRSDPN